jgi:cell division protein FtsB
MDSSNSAASASAGHDAHARLAAREKELAALEAERTQLVKQVEDLRAERQVLEAVSRKVATTRYANAGESQP